MAKVDNATVWRLVEQAGDVSELALTVAKNIHKIGTVENPLEAANSLVAYARHLLEAAGKLMTQHDLQTMRERTNEARKELEKLTGKND